MSLSTTNAIKLLCGVKDEDIESFTRQVSNLVSTDGIVTSSIERLLTIFDPQNRIFADGCRSFLTHRQCSWTRSLALGRSPPGLNYEEVQILSKYALMGLAEIGIVTSLCPEVSSFIKC
jgi:hypothetical protein